MYPASSMCGASCHDPYECCLLCVDFREQWQLTGYKVATTIVSDIYGIRYMVYGGGQGSLIKSGGWGSSWSCHGYLSSTINSLMVTSICSVSSLICTTSNIMPALALIVSFVFTLLLSTSGHSQLGALWLAHTAHTAHTAHKARDEASVCFHSGCRRCLLLLGRVQLAEQFS